MRRRRGTMRTALAFACLMAPACRDPGDAAPRHLLLISVDTLRADHLGSYGHPLDLTPALDELARRSTRFERAYATAPFTLPSVASLHTGRHPEELGIRGNIGRLPAGVPTLAQAFRARGFATAAAVGSFVLRPPTGLDRGFDRFDASFPVPEDPSAIRERGAAAVTDAALGALDALRADGADRVFLWVHYQDPHGPYTPPAGYRERYLEAERAVPGATRQLEVGSGDPSRIPEYQRVGEQREISFYRAGYAGEVAYTDSEIRRLLAGLRERGLLDGLAVVFTADHGEALGERDYWFAHGEHLDQAALRVPLILHLPGGPSRARIDVASLVDLAPTLARLFELDLGALPGRDLLDLDAPPSSAYFMTTREAASAERVGLTTDSRWYVRSLVRGRPVEKLYLLPDETRDVGTLEPRALRELRRQLDALRGGFEPRAPERERRPDAEELETLRALGYGG